ncbi:MAG TPA: heavy metal-associated domain-containing protein [Myxococcota bacterium]|jgi:copper chaperone CopZ|nr:heavy metal-associated domain-containing protein [Myxococcota bacterium]
MRKRLMQTGVVAMLAALLAAAAGGCADECKDCDKAASAAAAAATAAPGAPGAPGAPAVTGAGLAVAVVGAGPGAALPAGVKKVVFAVDGMTCEGCATGVMAALKGIDGVQDAGVQFASGEAWAVSKKEVAEATLVAAIEKHGYKATVKSITGG